MEFLRLDIQYEFLLHVTGSFKNCDDFLAVISGQTDTFDCLPDCLLVCLFASLLAWLVGWLIDCLID